MKLNALILLTTAAVVSGCSTSSDLDLSKFVDDPCRLFTGNELNPADEFHDPKLKDTSQGPHCFWGPKAMTRPGYSVTLSTKKTFEELKEKARKGQTFRETTVAGYPAFVSNVGDGQGTCDTTVAASDGAAVEVQITTNFRAEPEYPIACELSEKLAGRVVEKLKA
ncbi:DUF3558 domain-containing protein [Lentzea aerocolonigenes]|uniref:DUF3558 domain-containing protein n=1 Tax=Lentzea aerocolonigenes TaxID=68170 RepID=UPI0004C30C21|nr:DUF3558 domain-containing protein [Lentzea aerocolonigenes]MCP2247961.1 Protein of unknown function (DUF3558) [Lentzea aerocolonigenes]